MKRIPWKRNHKCEQPSRVVFYDTETLATAADDRPGVLAHRLHLGVAHAWTNYQGVWSLSSQIRFTDSAEFWGFIYDFSRQRRPTWVYSHNQAFDFTIVDGWRELDIGNLRIIEVDKITGTGNGHGDNSKKVWRGKTALDGTPFILETRSDRGPIKFVDSYNYWPVPLSKLGRSIGLDKLEFPDWTQDNEDVFRYCERDVEIVEKAVLSLMKFWKENDLGNWQTTGAGLSFSAYRHGQETCQIVAHGDQDYDLEQRGQIEEIQGTPVLSAKDVTDCERRSYYGGRTSVYFLGDIRPGISSGPSVQADLYRGIRCQIPGPITVLDVNSLYPFVMQEYYHPIELLDAIRQPTLTQAARLVESFPCCADVEIISDDEEYPVRIGSSTGYCTGSLSTSLCGPELSRAFATGKVAAVTNLCVYLSGRPFRNFITDWHKRRVNFIESGLDIEADFCKMIMNNLYGKLAQKTPPWETCGHVVPPVQWGGFIGQSGEGQPPCFMRAIAGVSQSQTTQRSCRHTFVAAASSVTSWGREYMRSLTLLCPPCSIVYMDTDSMFCLPSAVAALRTHGLIHPSSIGKLKDKGTYDTVRIWGLKDYELDGVRVIAGLKASAREISERLWEQVNFEGVKQIIQHDPDGSLLQSTVRFSPSVNIPSHSVGWDGWTKLVRVE